MTAGTVTIGDLVVNRIGFGAMRLTGPGIFGPPPDVPAAVATVRSLPALGVNYVDTANAYGPLISETIVRTALHPYRDMLVSTKGGMLRPAAFQWKVDARPEVIRTCVDLSLQNLGVERIDLWFLHRIDPDVPLADQLGIVAELQRAGKLRHVGLSDCTVEQLDAAREHVTVACVQSAFHLLERKHEPMLERCAHDGIPFIAYFPLATGALAAADSVIARVAEKIGCTPAQAALAWLLKRAPNLVVIPGTANPAHARENVAAADVTLTDEQFAELDRVGRKAALLRAPKS